MQSKLTVYVTTQIIFALLVEDLLVSAVNSPQMTFFTPPSHESTIHLESKYGYSATLKLSRPMPFSASLTPSRFSRSNNSSRSSEKSNERKLTEYVVLGPDYPFHGVTAVIQELNLREDIRNNDCVDFVQFGLNSSISTRSPTICGHISKENNDPLANESGASFKGQRAFFNPEGVIHVFFYSDPSDSDIANQEENHGKIYGESPGENRDIGVEIVFTSYTVCPNPANSWKKLKACSTVDQMSCIYSTLFCDSKVDCGFPGEYGIDEEGCYYPYIYMTVSIVSSLFITTALIYLFVRWVTKVPKEYQ